jgi:hypothetical protein
METTRYRSNRNARCELYLGENIPIETVCTEIEQIPFEHFQRFAQTLLNESLLSTYCLTPPEVELSEHRLLTPRQNSLKTIY